MAIPLLQGRSFTERDSSAGPKVAILNETARHAQNRGRATGDVRDGAGSDARDRPDVPIQE
jgi:hypothetical protein